MPSTNTAGGFDLQNKMISSGDYGVNILHWLIYTNMNNMDIHLKIFPIYDKNWLFNNADYER